MVQCGVLLEFSIGHALVLAPSCHSVVPIPSASPCKVREVMPISDRTSKALAEASLLGEPRTYDATSKCSGVSLSTLYHRDHRQPSREAKAHNYVILPDFIAGIG